MVPLEQKTGNTVSHKHFLSPSFVYGPNLGQAESKEVNESVEVAKM